ncbi:MAG: TIGR02302 family protein [Thalassobaculales bacterium]
MTDSRPGSPAPRPTPPDDGIDGRRIALAWAAIAWERLWPALAPAAAVAGLFVAVALLDLLPLLDRVWHGAALFLTGGLIAFLLARGLKGITLPDRAAARRRIELASGLAHRPLSALADRLPGGTRDPAAIALWQAYQARLRATMRRLKVGLAAPGLAWRDPWGLRAVVVLALAIGLAAAGEDAASRLARAMVPGIGAKAGSLPATVDAWLSPPAYTALPPVYLDRAGGGETVRVVAGTTALVQVHGGQGAAELVIDQAATPLEAVDRANQRLKATLTIGSRLALRQAGRELAAWPIEVVPDRAPTAEFRTAPARTERAALKLDYLAEDDFGVESVAAAIRRRESTEPDSALAKDEEVITIPLPLPGIALKKAEAASFHDLTAHRWAGLPVEIRILARDALDQQGSTEAFVTTLPERVFQHPVARAIVEQRKQLTLAPEERRPVADALNDIHARPDRYRNDTTAFLTLRAAIARLHMDQRPEAVAEIQQMLWEVALRIEEGEVASALRELREIERALQEALARDAPDEEIQRLIDQLQAAMDKYLEAMAEQMKEAMRRGDELPQIDPNQMMQRQDLQKMLDQLRDAARQGAKERAKDMLSRLQEMMENLRAGVQQQQQNARQQQQNRMMQELRDLTQRQEQLLDQTFGMMRQQQQQQGQGQQPQRGERGMRGQSERGQSQMQPGGQGRAQGDAGEMMSSAEGSELQEALRRALGDMMRQLGEMGDIPDPLGRAERAMRESSQQLGRGQPGQAVDPQTEALDQLQQGARDLAEQMRQQMQMGQQQGDQGEPPGGQQRQNANNRDPLGRPVPNSGSVDTGDVNVPEQADMQRAREIFDELRRRAADPARPSEERDYLDRLLKRF